MLFARRQVPEPDDPPPLPGDLKDERERVMRFKRDQFEAVGIPFPLSLQLAAAGADWHSVVKAMDRGISLELLEEVFL